MAIFFLRAKIIARSAGQNSVACAAYRSGQKLYDPTEGKVHDYTRKKGVLASGIETPENSPAWMKKRGKLWAEIEKMERRKDAQLAREFIVAVPDGLNDKVNELTEKITSMLTDRGMVVDWALHEPNKEGDDRNYHWHMMTTMRSIDGDTFGKKVREWNDRNYLNGLKKEICEVFNNELSARGLPVVDWRSYADQGITDRVPQTHQGPAVVNMRRKKEREIKETKERINNLRTELEENKKKQKQKETELLERMRKQGHQENDLIVPMPEQIPMQKETKQEWQPEPEPTQPSVPKPEPVPEEKKQQIKKRQQDRTRDRGGWSM